MQSTSGPNHFSQVKVNTPPRSSFDLSHGVKTTIKDGDYLTPIFVYDVMPNSTLNVRLHAFARLSTPIRPVMDNMFMETTWFFVPYRTLQDNFKKLMGEQINPTDSTDYLIAQIQSILEYHKNGSIYDHMGLPTYDSGAVTGYYEHSALPLRAYNEIWNYWFRDQNLQPSVVSNKHDGPDNANEYLLLKRNKKHDYFTSCLPWPQKGDEVTLPLGTRAPIATDAATVGTALGVYSTSQSAIKLIDSNQPSGWAELSATGTVATNELYADLSSALAATVNQLYYATAIQRLYVTDARGGTRYNEVVFSHFRVTNPDARLQRPEYLGGGRTPINFTAVPQTSETGTTPQGNMGAYGTASVSGHGFTKSFSEHGVVLGLLNVRADLTYQQGLPRWWSRQTRFDFYWPELAHIGEQEVLTRELYCTGTANDTTVFGYQERFADERYKPSMICGQFRSNDLLSLDLYHLSQDLLNPVLNSQFIESDTPVERVVATPSDPHYLYDSYIKFNAALPLPTYSIPGGGNRL